MLRHVRDLRRFFVSSIVFVFVFVLLALWDLEKAPYHVNGLALVSLVLSIITFVLFGKHSQSGAQPSKWIWLALICLWIPTRLPTTAHLTGGQDQGLYPLMAYHFLTDQSHLFNNEFQDSLPPPLREMFDKNSGAWAPGIKRVDPANASVPAPATGPATYQMPFYPALPAFLSLVGHYFGPFQQHWGLALLSLLSLVSFVSLITRVAGRQAGLIGGLLFLVQPVLSYVARTPFSESYSLLAFWASLWFFVEAVAAPRLGERLLWFVLAVIGVVNLQFSRMAFPLEGPHFLMGGVALAAVLHRREANVTVSAFMALTLGTFLYSWSWLCQFYPLLYEPIAKIYYNRLGTTPNQQYFWGFTLIGLSLLITVLGTMAPRGRRLVRHLFYRKTFARIVYFVATVVILYGAMRAFQAVRLGTNDGGWEEGPWNLNIIPRTAFYRVVLAGLPTFIAVIFLKPQSRLLYVLILLSAVSAFLYYPVQFATYPLYFDRYLTPVLIPMLLATLAVALQQLLKNRHRHKFRLTLCFLSISILWLPSIVSQLFRHEGDQSTFYRRLDNQLGPNDLLIFDESVVNRERTTVRSGVENFVHERFIPIPAPEALKERSYKEFAAIADKVYLLTQHPQVIPLPGYRVELADQLHYTEMFFVADLHEWVRGESYPSRRRHRWIYPYLRVQKDRIFYLFLLKDDQKLTGKNS
jgi:hypothetical protein